MRPGAFLACVTVGLVAGAPTASPARADSTPSWIALRVCPNVTTTTYLQSGQFPPDCGPAVASPGDVFVNPDNTCTTPPPNTDLGTFVTTQNPLGAEIHAGAPNNCATSPPTLGPGADGAELTVTVAQAGFCPTTLTVGANSGPIGGVVFPIGRLPLGTYSVTATLPDQTVTDPQTQRTMSWMSSQVSGTLRIGTTFSETDTGTLAGAGKSGTFAALLSNSFAGTGAGRLTSGKTGNRSMRTLRGTDYYACGTIGIAATVTYGKRGSNGVVRLHGKGSLTGGAGNYRGIKGAFTVSGSYNTRTNRARFVLRGTATF